MKYLELVCGACGGLLVKVRKGRFNRAVYNCKRCKNNELMECTVCRNPRQIWADEGKTICAICATDYQEGKIKLTPGQRNKLRKRLK
ncbi:MAG: hypothetical protein NTX00_05765 [Candidatus Parcubacteria bacterium]|nr:hypothetical protein [Candidatus Parcubacteria bacterium]